MAMTVTQAIRAATERLAATSDTARLDAELLMAHALGITRSDLLLNRMQDVLGGRTGHYDELVARRASCEPIAYITGTQEFHGRPFTVSPDVLIPRSDSETLIEAALAEAGGAQRVLDLGTGSGALLVTTLVELARASGVGIDASPAALRVAQANAQAHGLVGAQARFLERNWRKEGWADDLGTFDLILCNPPYVEDDAPLDPDVRDYEPASALFAGKDGLDDYRVLIPQVRKLMNRDAVAIFEIGHTQADAITEIAQFCGFSVRLRKDLANRPRCVVLR